MRLIPVTLLLFVITVTYSCGGGGSSDRGDASTSWNNVKRNAAPDLFLAAEFNAPRRLSIATLGWEDGLYISRNGLHLYATYIPADFLSFVLSGDSVEQLQYYDRGPHYGMDLTTNPTGGDYPWYHSDIVYAGRASINDEFSAWQLSGMQRPVYSEGGVSALFSGNDTVEALVFTSNEEYSAQTNIKIITGSVPNPLGVGTFIAATDSAGISSINTLYTEDNPHIERVDASTLLLFFDSEDRPGGMGSHDLWYALSEDNGATWSTPQNVTTINTPGKEHQPHLYHDGRSWWLYYSTYYTDNKLAIFRAQQETPNDWNRWGAPQIVLGAGTSQGVGEPTLTQDGDLCFVVVYENPTGTPYNRYDSDPWCMSAK